MEQLPTVSEHLDRITRFVARTRGFWAGFGRIESALLEDQLPDITAPIYISGLARSGSTMLLECLATHPDIATHRYLDFPFIYTPYLNNMVARLRKPAPKRERAHGDGILISPESPESMEEPIWEAYAHGTQFTKDIHQHIGKLLLARKRSRYASKSNNAVARLELLHAVFPDVRLLIPVRDPVEHIASLMRQHARFSKAGRADPKVVRHMEALGHREFGLNRVALPIGNMAPVIDAWKSGYELTGWALYWNEIYRHVADLRDRHAHIRDSSLIIWQDEFTATPRATLERIARHASLSPHEPWLVEAAAKIRPMPPTAPFSEAERAHIHELTAETVGRLRL